MIEMKITGATPQEFANNLLQATALMLNGARKTTAPAADTPPAEQPQVAEPLENPKSTDALDETPAPKKPRGRPRNPPKQVDLEEAIAAKKPELPPGGDPVPDLTGKGDTPKAEAPQYTADDCRKAVQTLYANYEKRARDGGESDENKIFAGKVAYAKQLVYGFGVQKVPDLKPAQYAEFIAAAQPYIDGTAELRAAA